MVPQSPQEPRSDTIKWYYQNPQVAGSYDGDRFTSLAGRTLNGLERRALAAALAETTTGGHTPLVLDAPCGTGRITEWLLELGCRVIGADIAGPMLAVARSRCARFGDRVAFVQADLEGLALPDRCVDLVTCIRLFHHITTEQRARILKELARVTRNGVIVNMSC